MKQLRPRIRPRIAILGLVLLLAVLVGAACAPSTPAGPASSDSRLSLRRRRMRLLLRSLLRKRVLLRPVRPRSQAEPSNLPVGVDADGNFYRGDPKAPVKLVEFSDFQ